MLSILLRSLSKYSWLRILLISLIASSIGTGLTFIIVFAELVKLQASPSSFAIAFILSTAPGLLGSILGQYLLKRIDPKFVIIIAEAIGMVGLLLPWYGLLDHSITTLQLAEIAASVSIGIAIPSINYYMKSLLDEEDIASGVILDNLIFACYVIFGIGLGSIIYGRIGSEKIILLDLLSYILSIVLISTMPSLSATGCQTIGIDDLPEQLTDKQYNSLLWLPCLAIIGAPAMALLPTLISTEAKGVNSILYLLFARSLGQLVGPMVIKEAHLKKQSSRMLIGCLVLFLVCYQLISIIPIGFIPWILVFVAHIFSNIVYSISWYNILTTFEKEKIAAATAVSYRKQIICGSLSSGIAGLVADKLGSQLALLICSTTALSCSLLLLAVTKRRH